MGNLFYQQAAMLCEEFNRIVLIPEPNVSLDGPVLFLAYCANKYFSLKSRDGAHSIIRSCFL